MSLMQMSWVWLVAALLGMMAQRHRVLCVFIALEGLMLSMLGMMYAFLSGGGYQLFPFLAVLSVVAGSAAMGLGILVGAIRLRGSDLSHMSSSMLY